MHALLKFNGHPAIRQVWTHAELHPSLSAVPTKPDALWSLGAQDVVVFALLFGGKNSTFITSANTHPRHPKLGTVLK